MGKYLWLVGVTSWFVGVVLASTLSASVEAEQVAYWPLDRVTETSTREWISGRFDVPSGYTFPVVPGEGRRGRALDFNGVDQFVEITSGSVFPLAEGSAAFWARPDSSATGVQLYQSDSPDGEPIDYNGLGSDGNIQEIHFASSGSWRFYYQDGSPGPTANSGGRFAIRGGTVEVGRWTHVAATWDRAGDMVLYVDCQEVARTSLTGGVFADHSPNEAFIGRPSEGGRHFAGLLDEVRVFDEALSSTEVAAFCSVTDRDATTPVHMNSVGVVDSTPEWLAVSNTTLSTGNGDTGGVLLHRSNGEGGWTSPLLMVPQSAVNNDDIGQSLSLDGDYFAVATGSTSGPRPVWIFEYTESTNWVEVEELVPPGGADFFGRSVSLSGDTVAVASPDINLGGGEVHVFRRQSSGQWQLEQTLPPPPTRGAASFIFGLEVELEGNLLAVRGYNSDSGAADFVVIWRRSGSQWNQEFVGSAQPFPAGNRITFDWGDERLAVGLPQDNDANASGAGGATILYYHPQDQEWREEPLVRSPIPTVDEGFGSQVALVGDWLIVSTSSTFDRYGVAYLYRRDGHGRWRHQAVLQPPETFNWDFGRQLHEDSGWVFATVDGGAELGERVFQFALPIFVDGFESGNVVSWSSSN